MYKVYYGKELLHDPRTDDTLLTSTDLELELNSSGSFAFTINHGHPMFDKISERDTRDPVSVYQDDSLIFFGDVLSIESDFHLSKRVECRGALAWLNDSIVRPYSTLEEESSNVAPSTVDGYFEWLIDGHNKQVEASKRFKVGVNDGSLMDADNHIYRSDSDYPNTGETIKKNLIEALGGYVRVRAENPMGYKYVDLLQDMPKVNAQVIDFGVNLLDFNKTDATDDMATFVIPLGAKMSETDYNYDDGHYETEDSKPVKGKEYYTRKYSKCAGMSEFESGVTYYERGEVWYQTSDSKPLSGYDYYIKKSKYTRFSGTSFASGTTYYVINYTYTKVTSGSMKYGTAYYTYNSKTKKYTKTSDTSFKSGVTYYTRSDSYKATSDTSPKVGTTYYALSSPYTKCDGLTSFASGTTYYENEKTYTVTGDSKPKSGKDYYLLDRNSYSSASNLAKFMRYTTYYEYNEDRDQKDDRLTVSIIGDDYLGGDYYKRGDMIYSESAVKEHGWIGAVVTFDDVTEANDLQSKGLSALKEILSPVRTIEVKAIDLSMLKPGYEPIMLGDYVRARSKPNDFDSYMLCSKLTIDLERPDENTFTLGQTFDVLTGVQNKRINALNATINNVYEAAGQISSEAKAALVAAEQVMEEAKSAQSTAEDVAEKVSEAQDSVESVQSAADEAAEQAAQAIEDATQAALDAAEAQKTADENTAKITLVETSVTEAKNAAADAQASADEAATAASNAQSLADAAGTAASNAQAAAETAQSTADGAATAAANAQSKADEAATAAGQAAADIIIINGEIDSIHEDATALRTDLEGQISSVTTTMEADYAKKTDLTSTETTLRTEIETSAAGIRTEVAQDYAKKTELTSVEANLQTQITQNADSITSTASSVTKAQADIAEVQTVANSAATAAANAQSTADTAKTDAANAQKAADDAASAAATAQSNATNAKSAADAAQKAADDAAADLATAQANLATVTSRVDATEDDIAEAQAAVATAQTAADNAAAAAETAKSAADTAQSTADTAKANAAAAKSTADTAKSNAAAAQTAADEAKAAADKAQGDVDSLTTRVTAAETKITQNSEAITLRATKTELSTAKSEAISTAASDATNKANQALTDAKSYTDSVEVGGRNYIFNSDSFTSGGSTSSGITASIEDGVWKVVTTSGNGNWNSWSKSNCIEDNFKTGDEFTFSIEIKCDEGSTGKPSIYFKPGMGYYTMQGSVSTEYSTLYYTGTWNDANDIRFHFGWSSTAGTFYIRRVKFEKGNRATDWTPAPEDMASVEQMNAAIEVKADSIAQTVAETYQPKGDYVTGTSAYSNLTQTVSGLSSTVQSHTGSISNLQQTAEGIQVRLENQQTVKNLVNNSRLLDGWGYVVSAGVTIEKNASTSAPEFGEVTVAQFNAATANSSNQSSYIHMTNAARVTSGSKYTLSVWARKVSGGNARPRLSLSTTNQSIIISENLTTEWKRYSYTFTLGTISGSNKYVDITTSFGVNVLAGQTGVFEICCPQLEAGETMNPWSASSVDSTDYMSFTGDGLVIGDMSEDELRNNVLIDSSSVQVRNGDKVMATFGAETRIGDLGKQYIVLKPGGIETKFAKEVDGAVESDPVSISGNPCSFSVELGELGYVYFELYNSNGDDVRGSGISLTVSSDLLSGPQTVEVKPNKYNTAAGAIYESVGSGTYTFELSIPDNPSRYVEGNYKVYNPDVEYVDGLEAKGSYVYAPYLLADNATIDGWISAGSLFVDGVDYTPTTSGNRWGVIPYVAGDGVMEAGKYIDFHTSDGDTSDYAVRMTANGSNMEFSGGVAAASHAYSGKLTLSSNVVVYDTGYDPVVRAAAGVVNVHGAVKPAASGTGSTTKIKIAGPIPAAYRPPKQIDVLCQGSSATQWLCSIDTSGYVYFSRYSKGGSYTSYTTSTWLPFNVTYII